MAGERYSLSNWFNRYPIHNLRSQGAGHSEPIYNSLTHRTTINDFDATKRSRILCSYHAIDNIRQTSIICDLCLYSCSATRFRYLGLRW